MNKTPHYSLFQPSPCGGISRGTTDAPLHISTLFEGWVGALAGSSKSKLLLLLLLLLLMLLVA